MSSQYFSVHAILNITHNRAATALNLVFTMISNRLILHYLVIWCYIYFTDLQLHCLLLPAFALVLNNSPLHCFCLPLSPSLALAHTPTDVNPKPTGGGEFSAAHGTLEAPALL